MMVRATWNQAHVPLVLRVIREGDLSMGRVLLNQQEGLLQTEALVLHHS